MRLENLIEQLCDTIDLTDAEVREELAAAGVDVDAAKARIMAKTDELMQSRAVRLAIAAVKANPPHPESPMPWRVNGKFLEDSNGDYFGGLGYREDAAHIAAAVNAAPVLIAEVERLQAQLEAARVATAKWPRVNHSRIKEGVPGTLYVNGLPQCPATYGRNPCECGADEANAARIEARRALGLEVSP